MVAGVLGFLAAKNSMAAMPKHTMAQIRMSLKSAFSISANKPDNTENTIATFGSLNANAPPTISKTPTPAPIMPVVDLGSTIAPRPTTAQD